MQSRPTLHDVSAAANVSTYTASRALSGGGGVSKETRERVVEIAAQLGYVPNQHARNLKSPQSSVVAVLTANIANHYYSVLVNSLEASIEGDGYDCVTMDAMLNGVHSQAREDRFVASIMAQRVAAAVVTYDLSAANMSALATWGIPLVFVDCAAPRGYEQYSSITTDSYFGSHAMGMHLAGHGHKHWAFVGHTGTWSSRKPREEGFLAAAAQTGSLVDVVEGMNSSEASCDAVSAYLTERPRQKWPEVFYASNTVLLHGIFAALRRLNVSVPDEVAIVAFDDFEWAEMIDPPVTVVDQDIVAIGRAAAVRLLQQIRGSTAASGENLVLKPTLRVRQSCGCGRLRALSRK